MSTRRSKLSPDAPEQYELFEKAQYQFTLNRRSFFKILGSGIAVTFTISNSFSKTILAAAPEDQIAAWIHVGENDMVTIYTGKAEVGQNIRTSLTQIVAEELPVSLEKIDMVLGDTALTPYDRGTFGSRSIPYMGPQLRKAAASARETLLTMAATEMKADRKQLVMDNGIVRNTATNQQMTIGQIAKGQKLVKPVDDKVATTPIEQWKIAGTSVKKLRGESFVTGEHKFVSDMTLPGMLYGKILRAPAYGATLVSADVEAARKMPGLTVVKDGDFIGVAAADIKTASAAIKAIKAEWKLSTQPSRKEIFSYIKTTAGKSADEEVSGAIAKALGESKVKIKKTFTVDYIAHAPLEPRAGLAQWSQNKLTVWTGTQRPFGVQEDLAEVFSMPKDQVRVIQPDTGSGYGGKHTGEAGIEAARLAKEADKPVKVVWTREEEFTWAYFRPAGVISVSAGANANGKLTAWEFHNYNSGGSGIETPYHVGEKNIKFHPMDSPLRQGSYRGLAATANVFARESIINDLAVELKIDPLEFRLKNVQHERMKGVLEAAAKKFGWAAKKTISGHGYGIACGDEKGSYVATCVEVMVDTATKKPNVLRVVVAFECGAIINPDHLQSQIEGAVIQGLGGALFEYIDFENGKILNPSFSKYRVPRFSDTPELEVVMVNRKDLPSVGAGETPILGIAPAIRNAIADATGERLYSLPLIQPKA